MTARSQLTDRVEGYSAGADNYLVKPVEQAELLLCIASLGRRLKAGAAAGSALQLNTRTLCLSGPAGDVVVNHTEALLLAALCRAAGQTLERWQAMQIIDNKDKGLVGANLEMRISSLRKKLSACGAPDDSIRTLRGFGYTLSCPVVLA